MIIKITQWYKADSLRYIQTLFVFQIGLLAYLWGNILTSPSNPTQQERIKALEKQVTELNQKIHKLESESHSQAYHIGEED